MPNFPKIDFQNFGDSLGRETKTFHNSAIFLNLILINQQPFFQGICLPYPITCNDGLLLYHPGTSLNQTSTRISLFPQATQYHSVVSEKFESRIAFAHNFHTEEFFRKISHSTLEDKLTIKTIFYSIQELNNLVTQEIKNV